VYRWIGSLNELKIFVDVTLAAKGSWSSPWGSVKLFSDIDSDIKIKLYGPCSQKLVIQTDNYHALFKTDGWKLGYFVLRNKESNKDISHETKPGAVSLAIEVCICTCSCSGKLLAAYMEGLKMEIAILELRLAGNSHWVSRVRWYANYTKTICSLNQNWLSCRLLS
jgi:hypothetical protein